MPITPLPTPVPSRADPANFAVRADAFLAALPTFATEANALEANVDAAEAVCLSVAQTVNVTAWSSVTSYAVGANVYDATTLLTYRRKTAGSGGSRPGLNGTDWQLLTGFGDVDLSSTQTLTSKTLGTGSIWDGQTIPVDHGGTGLTDGSNLLPPGIVGEFARNTAPTGWLKANGAAIPRTTYAALFAAIGTTFGAGNGTTTFNVPDLRGEFIRGWDDGRGVDSGRAFGSAQSGAVESHTHSTPFANVDGRYTATGSGGTAGGTTSTGATGGTETRPRNVALLACVKF